MSFARYEKYKSAGLAWLAEVPAHWSVLRLKNVLEQRITDGPHTTPVFIDDGIPFLSVDGIQDGELQFEGCRFISDEDHIAFRTKALPRRDDLLMGKAASTGKIARVKVDYEFSIWSPLALIRIDRSTADPAFVEYALKSPIAQGQIDNYCTSNTQKNISMDDIPRLIFVRPPLPEQAAIVTFLTYETAKIDALVEEQKRLIELLKEKRQAVISQAVTKGLDPTVPMTDSGVEWLGKVPTHWQIQRLKTLAESIKAGPFGSSLTKDQYVVSGYRVYGQEQVIPDDFTIGDYYVAPEKYEELRQYATRPGDILISCVGTFGKIALVPEGVEEGIINPRLIRLRVGTLANPEFLCVVLRSGVTFEQFAQTTRGGTMDVINIGTLAEIQVALPPLGEQNHITSYVENVSSQLDALTEQAEFSIALLLERRSALVSAAVTGKIDVRGLVPPPEPVAT